MNKNNTEKKNWQLSLDMRIVIVDVCKANTV